MSAAKVMRYTVVVRHPETDIPTAVLAGQPRPDWAKDLVHDDDLVSTSKYEGDAAPAADPSDGDAGSDQGSESGSGSSDSGSGATKSIDDMTAAELKTEIDARNEGRADDAKISKSGTKDKLLAALKADTAQG